MRISRSWIVIESGLTLKEIKKKQNLNVQTYFTQSSAPLPLLRFSSGFIYTSNQKNPIHRKCLWLSSSPQTWGSLFISTNILELQSAGFAHVRVRAHVYVCTPPRFIFRFCQQNSCFTQVSFYCKFTLDSLCPQRPNSNGSFLQCWNWWMSDFLKSENR